MDTNPGVGCRVKRNNSLIKPSAGGEGFIMRKRYPFFCPKLLFFTLLVNLQMMFSVKTMLTFFVAGFLIFFFCGGFFFRFELNALHISLHKKEHCHKS